MVLLSVLVGDGCGYTVLGPESGTFTSINYPYIYPNSTVCEWEIRVKPEERVQLKFGDFDIDDSDCHFNYVRVYNGIGPTRTEIGKNLFLCCRKVSLYVVQNSKKLRILLWLILDFLKIYIPESCVIIIILQHL